MGVGERVFGWKECGEVAVNEMQVRVGRVSEGARRILDGSSYIAESREMEKKDESARAGVRAAGAI